MQDPKGARFSLDLREFNGALGDLGTLLPLMLGTIAVVGLAPVPVLLGFSLFYIVTALYYRLPIPVQPMKAVAAVLLTAEIGPAGLAASGVVIGVVLVLAGATGGMARLARLVPQSVLAGLQLGLGVALSIVAVGLIATAPAVGVAAIVLLAALLFVPRCPSAVVALAAAVVLAYALDVPGHAPGPVASAPFALPGWPDWVEFESALTLVVLPQLSLTFTNAVVLTALLAADYFGPRAAHVTPARLSLTSGIANLALTPFGALPMCHGAGGLAAHHRFGARSGTAPLVLGALLAAVALWPAGGGVALLAAIPAAGLGALLLVASAELAFSRRLFDCRPSCWPVIATTAGITVWFDPFWGLLAGLASEGLRCALVRRRQRTRAP